MIVNQVRKVIGGNLSGYDKKEQLVSGNVTVI